MFRGDSKINTKFYPPKRPVANFEEESPFSPITPGAESRMNVSTFTTFLENNCMLRYYDISGRDSSPSKTRAELLSNKKSEESTFSTYLAKNESILSTKGEKSDNSTKPENTKSLYSRTNNTIQNQGENEVRSNNQNIFINPTTCNNFSTESGEIDQNRMYSMNYQNNYNPSFYNQTPYSGVYENFTPSLGPTPYPGVNMNMYDMMHHNAYMWNQPSIPFFPYHNMNPALHQNYPYQYPMSNMYMSMPNHNIRGVNPSIPQKNESSFNMMNMNNINNNIKKPAKFQEANIRELKNKNSTKTNISHFATMNEEELVKHSFNLAKDQSGCRYLQKKIEEEGEAFHNAIYGKIAEHTVELMNDSFGNYLIQKLLDYLNNDKLFHIIAIVRN